MVIRPFLFIIIMVPGERIELSLPKEHDFESCASTSSAIRAQSEFYWNLLLKATYGYYLYMKDIYKILDDLAIDYKKYEHPPIMTVEEGVRYRQDAEGLLIKNIFLRNKRGQRHYLVVIPQTKEVDLVKVRECVQDSKLGFAQEEYLKKYLGLTPGSVSLLGLVNDEERHVQVVIDNEVWQSDLICVHPNINTATLEIRREDLQKFLDFCGNTVHFYDL